MAKILKVTDKTKENVNFFFIMALLFLSRWRVKMRWQAGIPFPYSFSRCSTSVSSRCLPCLSKRTMNGMLLKLNFSDR